MEIKNTSVDNVKVIELAGKLDGNSSTAVQEAIMPQVAAECRLCLDMSRCDYVSSAGLRVLLMVGKSLARVGGRGVIAGLPDDVKEVMEMTGFDNIFENYGTVKEAVKAIK